MVIATGSSAPHLKALFSEVQHFLKQQGSPCYRRSGAPECGWMVVDFVDVVVHVFSPTARDYYAIEDLWPNAPEVK